jgi:hypothetical protein
VAGGGQTQHGRAPTRAGDHSPPDQAGRAGGPGAHQKTRMGRPRPTANAREDQDPDAGRPERQARAGVTPGGQGERTKPARAEPGSRARARTRAADLRAKADRPDPKRPEATAKTTSRSAGQAARAAASAPDAHPVVTEEKPARRAPATTARTHPDPGGPSAREPHTPNEAINEESRPTTAGARTRPRHQRRATNGQRSQANATNAAERRARKPTTDRHRGGPQAHPRQAGATSARQTGRRQRATKTRRPRRHPKTRAMTGGTKPTADRHRGTRTRPSEQQENTPKKTSALETRQARRRDRDRSARSRSRRPSGAGDAQPGPASARRDGGDAPAGAGDHSQTASQRHSARTTEDQHSRAGGRAAEGDHRRTTDRASRAPAGGDRAAPPATRGTNGRGGSEHRRPRPTARNETRSDHDTPPRKRPGDHPSEPPTDRHIIAQETQEVKPQGTKNLKKRKRGPAPEKQQNKQRKHATRAATPRRPPP